MEDSPADSADPLPPTTGEETGVGDGGEHTALPETEARKLGRMAIEDRPDEAEEAASGLDDVPLALRAATAELGRQFRSGRIRGARTA